jgi:hypothetical protein
MLSNPDIQLNAMINRWITTILLFNFKLVHVPAKKHKRPDRLSRCKPVLGEEEEDDDPKDWVDSALTLGTWVVSWLNTSPADALHTDALILSLNTIPDDEDSGQLIHPHHDCCLPT